VFLSLGQHKEPNERPTKTDDLEKYDLERSTKCEIRETLAAELDKSARLVHLAARFTQTFHATAPSLFRATKAAKGRRKRRKAFPKEEARKGETKKKKEKEKILLCVRVIFSSPQLLLRLNWSSVCLVCT